MPGQIESQHSEDAPMNDAPGAHPVQMVGAVEQLDEIDVQVDRDRIRVLTGATETAASFQFDNEDHTLGNALRYIIMKNPDVEFCGYSIPHPSEAKMNIRIQTYVQPQTNASNAIDGVSVYDVLEKGLKDLEDLCDVVLDKFSVAREEFHTRGGQ
ncbi:putative DNA-directed RNA polymerases I and III 16 kDa polypeptide [Dendryphion nanum]|uniref:DNA-directed RNA polymerases I and III 16 kDa polypeptide n=1 Tax=Dendryphion nanum TaxID=256645 RepID=A0A9P9DB46_9PLEO|nr:putative DNA-directed RNA polymerases I and III 16 kDa polypeptide [Dendryphion nanum]